MSYKTIRQRSCLDKKPFQEYSVALQVAERNNWMYSGNWGVYECGFCAAYHIGRPRLKGKLNHHETQPLGRFCHLILPFPRDAERLTPCGITHSHYRAAAPNNHQHRLTKNYDLVDCPNCNQWIESRKEKEPSPEIFLIANG